MSSSTPACRTISVRCFSSWLLSRRDGKRWCCAWAGGDKLKWSDTVCGQKNVEQKWAKQHVITRQILGLYACAVFQTCHQSNHPFLQVHISLREGTSKIWRLCQGSWAARRNLWRKIRPSGQPAVPHDLLDMTVVQFAGLSAKRHVCLIWMLAMTHHFPNAPWAATSAGSLSTSKYGCRSRPGWHCNVGNQLVCATVGRKSTDKTLVTCQNLDG